MYYAAFFAGTLLLLSAPCVTLRLTVVSARASCYLRVKTIVILCSLDTKVALNMPPIAHQLRRNKPKSPTSADSANTPPFWRHGKSTITPT